jgi:hypothetical protein
MTHTSSVTTDPKAKFWLGRLVVTANAETDLDHEDIYNSVNRHLSGDWGDLCVEDKDANVQALQFGGRLFSAYHDPATFWQAGADDTNAWLQVDLERIVTISQTKLTFPVEGSWRYKIEISIDGNSDWKLVADQSRSGVTEKVRNDIAQSGARGRFLRVTFTSLPAGQSAALAELVAIGVSE